jgi:acetyl-CoA C-acetyltransferase
MQQHRRVAIVGGNRIPFARSNTAYAHLGNPDMLLIALNGLVDRFGLHGEALGQVVGGAVLKHARDFNMVREVVLRSKLSPFTPANDLQMACGTGMEAAIAVANKIALGQMEVGVACGVDTTSDAPIAVNRAMQQAMMAFNRAKTNGDKFNAIKALLNPAHLAPEIPKNSEASTGKSMGQHAEMTAKRWGVSRTDQDQLAIDSHNKLAAAYDAGFYDDLVTPCKGLSRDNNLRPGSTLEKLASLPPAFDKNGGTLSAANSTPLTDGASSLLLASEDWAKAHGLPILAYVRDVQVSAVEFRGEQEGLLMAPAYAVSTMLARNGLKLQDFSHYEIHEAFAAQVLCTLAAWESEKFCQEKLGLSQSLGKIDFAKLNVKGGSLAAGHPFAATGGRCLATVAKTLQQNGGGRGLVSVCAAGGLGVTMIIEGS